MTSKLESYGSCLQTLYENLSEKLIEDEFDSKEKIQCVVNRVIDQFKQGLECNERVKENFITTPLEHFYSDIINPLAQLAKDQFTMFLNEIELEHNKNLIDAIKKYTEKKNHLVQYEQQISIDDDDDDSLHLDE